MKHIQAMTVKCLLQRRVDPLSGWSFIKATADLPFSLSLPPSLQSLSLPPSFSPKDVSCGAVLKLLVKFPITGEADPKLIIQGKLQHITIST